MTLATFPVCSRYVRAVSQHKIEKNQMAAMDFESAASTIPPLGQAIACNEV